MSKKMRILISMGAVILGLTTFGLYLFFSQERVIATVGDYKITKTDKELRDQIQWIFYPKDPHSYGLDQLTNAFIYAQILKNNGHEVTEAILRAEDMRINQNTKAPEVLKKIRDLFKGNDELYQKVFVLPTYAERTIYYDFFNKNAKVQEPSLKVTREVLQKIETTKAPLEQIAQESNLNFRRFTLSKSEGLVWEPVSEKMNRPNPKENSGIIDMSNQPPPEIKNHIDQEFKAKSLESALYWIDNVLKNMKPGEVLQSPVDYEESWLVVKFVKVLKKDKFQMEAIFIPKVNYQQWLEMEKAKVMVKK